MMANELVFKPTHGQLDANDPRWDAQVQELMEMLKAHAAPARKAAGTPEEGKKGIDASSIILALGSAGVVTAAVQVFMAWLKRDKKRSLSIKTTKQSIEINGDNLSEEVLLKALEAGAAKQGAGG